MVPPKCERLPQKSEDSNSILKAISSTEEIISSSTIPEVKEAAENEIKNLLKDLNELRER
jgi:protein subunit release factor A